MHTFPSRYACCILHCFATSTTCIYIYRCKRAHKTWKCMHILSMFVVQMWALLMGTVFQANGVILISPDYRNFPQGTCSNMVCMCYCNLISSFSLLCLLCVCLCVSTCMYAYDQVILILPDYRKYWPQKVLTAESIDHRRYWPQKVLTTESIDHRK